MALLYIDRPAPFLKPSLVRVPVPRAYGGMWAVYGWMWMAGSSFFLLSKGVLAVLQGQIKSHKRWMTHFYVSMWCDFLASWL